MFTDEIPKSFEGIKDLYLKHKLFTNIDGFTLTKIRAIDGNIIFYYGYFDNSNIIGRELNESPSKGVIKYAEKLFKDKANFSYEEYQVY